MKSVRLRILLLTLFLPLALSLSQCKKNDAASGPATPAAASGSSAVPAASTAKAVAALIDQAANFGFAASLPQDTEFYFGSVGAKKHIEALKKSAFYKEISALISDKTPAPSAGDKPMKALQQLLGDDMFMSGGKGFEQFAVWFREFNAVYNELNFHALMAGTPMGGGKASGSLSAGTNLGTVWLNLFLADPSQLDRALGVVSRFDVPPVMIGFKVDKAADVVRDLLPEEALKRIPPDKFTVTTQNVAGGSLTVITGEGSKMLGNEQKKQILDNLPPTFNDQTRKAIEKALTEFQTKKFAVGWGAIGGHVIFACGKNLDHVRLAASPAESLIVKAEMAPLATHAGKNLFAVLYSSAGTLNALIEDKPFTPILRGVIGAMKENPSFSNMAAILEAQLGEYAGAEAAVFHQDMTATAAAMWWDKGIHVESYGGARAKSYDPAGKLQFARMVDQPGVVLGVAYRRSLPFEKSVSKWMETFTHMAYTGAQELMKAGFGGDQAGQGFAMFETTFLPTLKKLYQADKDLAEKGLGGETAFILDVNGTVPPLPGIPPEEAKGQKFPRITSISEVANRTEVAAGWQKMSASINEAIAGYFSLGSPRSPDGSAAGTPPPGLMPEPISTEKNGVTSWFYALPLLTGDLLPCASINDKFLLLGTSKGYNEFIAGELAKPAPASLEGVVWRFDPAALVDATLGYAKLGKASSAKNLQEMKQVQKWIKPFHAMQGRVFQDGSTPRQSLTWEITDLVSFD